MTRPPLRDVPYFATCPACDQPFRATVSWSPSRPAYRRNRCPWCGASVLIGRNHS